MGLGGCGTALTTSPPHPDRPEIASVSQETNRVRSGCPMKLRFAFRDAEGNVARAIASWAYEGGSAGIGSRPARIVQDGFAAVALDPSSLRGRGQGEAEIVLTPLQPGQYRYSVQVEDAAGHRSNVLERPSRSWPNRPARRSRAPSPCGDPNEPLLVHCARSPSLAGAALHGPPCGRDLGRDRRRGGRQHSDRSGRGRPA